MGGLSKKAFKFTQAIDKSGLPHLTIDGGALLFKGLKLTRGQEEQERLTATAIARSYDLMGYDAVGISNYDLTGGLDFLIKLSKTVNFPWLSANLVNAEDSKPLFKSYIIVPVAGVKIGVIGLTDPAAKNMLAGTKGNILPWKDVLPDILARIQSKTDMIILLSSLPPAANRIIAQQFSNIHLILQAGRGGGDITPKAQDNTIIAQTARQGKYIGVMDITWRQSHRWGIDKAGTLKKQQGVVDRLNWQIGKYEKHGDPLVSLKEYPNKLQIYKRLLKKRRNAEQKIKQLSQEIKNNQGKPDPSTFKNRFIAMETSLPDDQRVKELVDELNKKINAMGKAQAKINQNLHKKYSGWRPCANCHPKILAKWQKTRHAKAYETLVNKNRQFNIDCLFCHVTGIDRENAADALSVGLDLRGVGCESCHGPGKKHIKDPKQFHLTAKPPTSLCQNCHTKEHDDSFIYKRDSRLVH